MLDALMPSPTRTAEAPVQPQRPAEFPVDRIRMTSMYSNFCQVIGLPEELLLDFGLNSSGDQGPTLPVCLHHRVVLNYYTAKRLLNALAFAVNRHENFFGPGGGCSATHSRGRPRWTRGTLSACNDQCPIASGTQYPCAEQHCTCFARSRAYNERAMESN